MLPSFHVFYWWNCTFPMLAMHGRVGKNPKHSLRCLIQLSDMDALEHLTSCSHYFHLLFLRRNFTPVTNNGWNVSIKTFISQQNLQFFDVVEHIIIVLCKIAAIPAGSTLCLSTYPLKAQDDPCWATQYGAGDSQLIAYIFEISLVSEKNP